MIPLGVIVQIYIPNGLLTGLGIALIPSGSFFLIYGTLLYYLGTRDKFGFPDNFTVFSILVVALGIILSAIPVLEPSYILPLELAGPAVFAYGVVNLMMQMQLKLSFSIRNLAIASILLLVAGILIPTLLHLFNGSGYLALANIPAITGVYMLFIPLVTRTFDHWKSRGYFQ